MQQKPQYHLTSVLYVVMGKPLIIYHSGIFMETKLEVYSRCEYKKEKYNFRIQANSTTWHRVEGQKLRCSWIVKNNNKLFNALWFDDFEM